MEPAHDDADGADENNGGREPARGVPFHVREPALNVLWEDDNLHIPCYDGLFYLAYNHCRDGHAFDRIFY